MRYRIISFLIFIFAISFNIKAKDYFAKIIENYDVDSETLSLKNVPVEEFWNSLVKNNMNVQSLHTDISKNRGAEKEALKVIGSMPRYDKKYRPDAIDALQPFCDSLFMMVGILDNIDRCIVADETVNAFTTFSSDGMVVALNFGLLDAKGMNDPMLAGVIAHEYAHALLFHHLRQVYDCIKRRKKNDIIKGVSVAMAAVSEVASSYADAMAGNEHSNEIFNNMIYNIEKSYHEDLLQYYFNYSRDLEYEADLIAYRFLEWSGLGGGNYIELLKLLGANNPKSFSDIDTDSDHPSINNRIAFINYVQQHPELKNTRNEKLEKKMEKELERMNMRADKNSDPIYY